jgi:3'-phosphoadenosine 5'-phosphosulfate sulfotransferase (PAPS reductase)/FAD synthetase
MIDLAPYRIEGPALISFSGGRTSAMMLKRIVEAHGGQLPDDIIVGFANTGKEAEATLRFVHEVETRWGVRVHWIEFQTDLRSVGPAGRFVEVGYNSASRAGEPFERLIERKQMVPTVTTGRSCTERLKVMALQDLVEAKLGLVPGQFVEVIGFRSDEDDRRKRLTATARNEARRFAFPLLSAGVRKADVFAFWAAQPFDLDLPRGFGNCDHCPFVGLKNRIARARRDPAGVAQWAKWELAKGVHMGKTYSFVEVLGLVAQSPELLPDDDADVECVGFCGS